MTRSMLGVRACLIAVWFSSAAVFAGCEDLIPDVPDADVDGGKTQERDAGDAGRDAGGPDSPLLNAPMATEVGSLTLTDPVTDVVYAEDLAIGLHEISGVSILDLSDPTAPVVIATLPTTGRAIGVAIDVQLRILFIVTVSGDLRAYRVSDTRNPIQLAQITVTEPGSSGDSIQGIVRVGYRLFLLGAGRLLPVRIQFGANHSVSFLAEADVALDGEPRFMVTGGGVFFVIFEGGAVQIWSAGENPAVIDEGELGADVVGVVARGRRLFVALSGVGLRVVDMTVAGQLRVLFETTDFDDLTGLERFGNLVIVSLSRGMLVALDLSNFAAPRPLVVRPGTLPSWIAPIGGNLILGGGTSLSVFGVPPFVSATLPGPMAAEFPRYGRLPLQLSKAIDPSTVTLANLSLTCGGSVIEGTVVVSLDNLRITFLPSSTLPAGVDCQLTLSNVRDALGLRLSSGPSALQFTTAMAEPVPVENPISTYPHTADGAFTDWEAGDTADFEYHDVQSAKGMYSHFYADFDGQKLWMLNDWFYNGDDIDPDCYNQFGVWTGGGSQWWEIRAYGDQHIEVRLGGQLLAADDARVTGAYSHVATPNDDEPHTVYEIAITTEPGTWGVQLHDPGPTFSCQNLETDPTNYNGASTMDGSSVDPTQAPVMPETPAPSVRVGGGSTGTTTLTWPITTGQGAFTSYVLELSTGDDLSNVFYRAVVYGGTFELPPGLLQPGMTYTFRVTASNLAGSVSSELITFTVPSETPGAPTLTVVDPNSIEQNGATTLTLTGTLFVQGARAYIGDTELSTTFVSSTSLTAMLTSAQTATVGTYDITVRNVPGDSNTASNNIKFNVTEPASTVVTLVSLSPTTVMQGVYALVTVTMTNAPSGTYYLVLTPIGGSALSPIFCDFTQTNSCDANVTLQTLGAYHARIQVGEGVGSYDTNQLDSALTVNAPVACVHGECLPGPRLASNCSTCATAVCAADSTCCSTAWSNVCVGLATGGTLTACSSACNPPSIALSNTLAPNTAAATVGTSVTVDLLDARTSGYTYSLRLRRMGDVDDTLFACALNMQTGNCAATVNLSVEGTYSAQIEVRDVTQQGQPQSYFTNTVMSAFTVTAAPPACFTGGGTATPAGMGDCFAPFVIDLSGASLGTILSHTTASGSDHTFGSNSCGWNTFNRVVYQVLLPAGATGYQVSLDPSSDANPQIAILNNNSCTTSSLCVDSGGAIACEAAQATTTTHFTGTNPYFVVNRSFGSLTMRVRAY